MHRDPGEIRAQVPCLLVLHHTRLVGQRAVGCSTASLLSGRLWVPCVPVSHRCPRAQLLGRPLSAGTQDLRSRTSTSAANTLLFPRFEVRGLGVWSLLLPLLGEHSSPGLRKVTAAADFGGISRSYLRASPTVSLPKGWVLEAGGPGFKDTPITDSLL